MVFTLLLPDQYNYVIAVATATTFVNAFHTSLTGRMRKAAKVPYPNAYVPAAEAATSVAKYRFNCAQKAHANFTETHPTIIVSMLVAGLHYPVVSASLGAVWAVGRVLYAAGYAREANAENGKGRMIGIFASPAQYVLQLMGAWSAFKLVTL